MPVYAVSYSIDPMLRSLYESLDQKVIEVR